MTDTLYRSQIQPGRDSFGQTLRAEWVKFRTVRGWVIGLVVAALAILALGLGPSAQGSCGTNGPASDCTQPLGPDGEEVTDSFYFAHQPLDGNGTITVRVTSLTGQIPDFSGGGGGSGGPQTRSGLVPWAKAGIIIKASTAQGSAYAAMMVTGGHGVQMQYDYTGDAPGLAGAVSAASPRWLRLTRSGDTFTGYDSTDGAHWTKVGVATLTGLPPTVLGGLFATSPQYWQATGAGTSVTGGDSEATGAFDHVSLRRRLAERRVGRHRHRRRGRPGGRLARGLPGGRRPVHGERGRRHRAVGVRGGRVRRHDRADPHRRVRRADRGGGGRGDVHDRRVPARPDPGHAGRHPGAGPGAGGQGGRHRRRHLRGRAGQLAPSWSPWASGYCAPTASTSGRSPRWPRCG